MVNFFVTYTSYAKIKNKKIKNKKTQKTKQKQYYNMNIAYTANSSWATLFEVFYFFNINYVYITTYILNI